MMPPRAYYSSPACGENEALRLTERVRPILDALYPGWIGENPLYGTYEFNPMLSASLRLISRIESRAEIAEMLGGKDGSPELQASDMHHLVWSAASAQWSTGHRHEAVLAASKAVNSMLQTKVQRRDIGETSLVKEAFSEKAAAVGKSRLRFPSITDEATGSPRRGRDGVRLRLF